MTMVKDPHKTENPVNDLFEQARAVPIAPSAALMARVEADARAIRPSPVIRAKPHTLSWSAIAQALGGWQGMGGLAMATCAGFWIGVSPPDALPDAGALIWGSDVVESADYAPLLSGFGWDIEEG